MNTKTCEAIRRSLARMEACCLIRYIDRVVGVVHVPLGDKFIAGLADVLTVDDGAAEHAEPIPFEGAIVADVF